MTIFVFNRYEAKFWLDEALFRPLFDRLSEWMIFDEANIDESLYTVNNLYFDTHDHELIRRSLSQPRYKEKLRLRAYGVPTSLDSVYLELKKKVSGLVNKRRISVTEDEGMHFVCNGERPQTNEYLGTQVSEEIAYMRTRYRLEPKVLIAYDRFAMFAKNNRDLRITFDTNIRTRRTNLSLIAGDSGSLLPVSAKWLMEIKVRQAIPFWLTSILNEFGLFRTRFSKFGNEYLLHLSQQHPTKEGQIDGSYF
jgi:hypothetical protein